MRLARLAPGGALMLVAWLNAYICRQVFFIEHTGQMHSMQGFWIAMARLGGNWSAPQWWPWSLGGMPLEFTYAPLVPAMASLYARMAGCSPSLAFNAVSGFIYGLGPVLLFVLAWRLTGRWGWSLVAAVAYSLTAPTELLLPDGVFNLRHLGDARRFSLNFIWDEAPHHLGLALVTAAVAAFHSGRRTGRAWMLAGAAVCGAAAMLASAFGAAALVVFLACYVAAWSEGRWKRDAAGAALVCLAGWVVACPFLPPSLLAAIRRNAGLFEESAWIGTSPFVLAAWAAGWLALAAACRLWKQPHLRFFLLSAYSFGAIAAAFVWKGWHFVPQAARYKVELELALVLLAVFAAARLAGRLPGWARGLLAIPLLALAAFQTIEHRRYSKREIRPIAIDGTIEHVAARWLEANLPGRRVLAAGSIGQWLNAFGNVPQFGGGSYPTAPNAVQQIAFWGMYPGGAGPHRNDAVTLDWLRAFGVDAIVVPGPVSGEFWKPFREPRAFDGVLPLVWRQNDTAVFAVPRRNPVLAHVIPESAAVRRPPSAWEDTGEVRRYVAALEDPTLPDASFEWLGTNRARIRADPGPGRVVSVQINYHPGWRAKAGGAAVPAGSDGLGQMLLSPRCAGACTIELEYGWSLEGRLTRAASLLALAGLGALVFLLRP